VDDDLKTLGVRRWRKRAEDREEWAIILKEAMVKLYALYARAEELGYLLHGATVLVELWLPYIFYVRFRDNFYMVGSSAPRPTPTWRTRGSLSVWHLPRNLSSMGGPASSYAAASITLDFIGAHKPPHPTAKCFRQGGDTIEGEKVRAIFILR
jgi:hypothetical protein